MTRYNCGGPGDGTRPDGNTHWDACDCVAERLRREGAEAERRAVVEWLRDAARQLREDGKDIGAGRYDQAALNIDVGRHVAHLRGKEGG